MPELAEKFLSVLEQSVEEICSSFTRSDDDFAPVLQVQNAAGELFIALIDGSFFESVESKDRLANDVIKPALNGLGGKVMGMVASTWMVSVRKDEELDVSPSNHPDRKEVVLVTAIDTTKELVAFAEIKRQENAPPTLGEWKQSETHSGRFTTGIQNVLRDSSGFAQPEFLAKLKPLNME